VIHLSGVGERTAESSSDGQSNVQENISGLPNRSGQINPNDLLNLRFIRDARLSPDGKKVAYAISRTVEHDNAEYCEVWIRDLQTGALLTVDTGSVFSTAPRWSPEGSRLAYVTTMGADCRVRVFFLDDASTREFPPALRPLHGPPEWAPDGTRLAICTSDEFALVRGGWRLKTRISAREGQGFAAGRRAGICILDVHSGAAINFPVDLVSCTMPKWSPRGDRLLLLGSATSAVGSGAFPCLWAMDVTNGNLLEVLGDGWGVEAAEWCPDGLHIVIAGSHASQDRVPAASLWVVGPDGSNPQRRTDNTISHVGFRFHHDMPLWDATPLLAIPNNGMAFVTVQRGGRSSIFQISLTGEVFCEEVIGGERSCVILDASPYENRLLYWVTSFSMPSELCVAHWKNGPREQQITDLNSAIMSGWPAMRTHHLDFTSADGLKFEGWHLVRQEAVGPQPTVMFIHGGPYMATGCVFRFDFWLLAARGFGVLFSNFRGSLGYGAEFSRAIDPEWGPQGLPDHIAAIDAAVDQGFADPRRLGVWGASHGGFATLWTVTHSDRFRAAVAEASITDFVSLYYLSDLPDFFAGLLGGKPSERPRAYRENSPLTYASQCRTPTLLIHGEDDTRCPLAGAESFHRALLDAGCVAELLILKGCTHMGDSIGPLSARLGQNEALVEWFERHL
jgi:dipeptidyl aminopeptidase/acylaminoacyl peptidase